MKAQKGVEHAGIGDACRRVSEDNRGALSDQQSRRLLQVLGLREIEHVEYRRL